MQNQTITQTIRIIYDGDLASTGSSLLTPAVVAAVLIVIGLLIWLYITRRSHGHDLYRLTSFFCHHSYITS